MISRDVEPWKDAMMDTRSEVDFAVVVGVEHYGFGNLRGAIQDAVDVHRWLCDQSGGGLDPDHAKWVFSEEGAKTPAQYEIDKELLGVLEKAHAVGGGRRLYFYFSGHGTRSGQAVDDIAMLLARWERGLARLALSSESYSSKLKEFGLFEELAIFVDCCRTPSVSSVGVAPTVTPQCLARPTRLFRAYASEVGHPAFEVPDNGVWRGVFTRCLLEILRTSGGVGAGEFQRRLAHDVEREAIGYGRVQRAEVTNGFMDTSRFGQPGGPAVSPMLRIKFVKRRGPVVLKNNGLEVVADYLADDQLWELSLPCGFYQIEGGGEPHDLFDHRGREVIHVF
ncbi:MAG TPA: caspase family protein [Kofleriaceae bacterium]|nr:caspase family protein [Kofleriaceae bacterium]